MTCWAATAIRQKYPPVHLTWITEDRCAPVIASPGLVNTLIEVPRQTWKRSRTSPKTWREQLKFYAKIRSEPYDWAIDFQGHSKTAIGLRLCKAKKKLMARSTDAFAKRLNPLMQGNPRSMHCVDWNHHVLQQFDEFDRPPLPLMPSVAPNAEEPFVSISVGAGAKNKEWSRENWVQVVGDWIKLGIPVKVLGGPTDQSLDVSGAVNLVGKLPLAKTLEVVAQSRVHVAADTGTGHMAAAYQIPQISIFGPSPVEVFRPYSPLCTVLCNGESPDDVRPAEVNAAVQALWGKL